jgi:hypothetical protein
VSQIPVRNVNDRLASGSRDALRRHGVSNERYVGGGVGNENGDRLKQEDRLSPH